MKSLKQSLAAMGLGGGERGCEVVGGQSGINLPLSAPHLVRKDHVEGEVSILRSDRFFLSPPSRFYIGDQQDRPGHPQQLCRMLGRSSALDSGLGILPTSPRS